MEDKLSEFKKLMAKKLFNWDMNELHCRACNQLITEFRDELSKKEFKISGMCQTCQDNIFGE